MRRDWPIMALLAAATIAVFWQVSWNGFVNLDDPAYVTHNPMVREGLTWAGVRWAFGDLHGEATYWHPVTWLSHMLDCQLFGLNPTGHHLTSLFLHTLNTVLLFAVLRRMTGRRGPSAMVAALFALHPLQVESVAWVAERKNVLSAFFFMLTLWAYARHAEVQTPKSKIQSQESNVQTQEPASGLGPHASRFTLHISRFYLLSLSFFALGLMSKPSLVPLPFVLLLLDYWPLARLQVQSPESNVQSLNADGRMQNAESATTYHASRITHHVSPLPLLPLLVEKFPFLALSAASSLLMIRAGETLGALVSTKELPIPFRLTNAVVACALYLRKLIWPVDLSVFYLHPGRWPAWSVAVSALLLLAVTAAAVWQARRRPYLIVGWLWFLGMLAPVIGLVQAFVQALADRFAYLPAIGVFLMVVWAAVDWLAHLAAPTADDHRWTQIDTDKKGVEPSLSTAKTVPPARRQEKTESNPPSGLLHLCSSVSICGCPLLTLAPAAAVLAGCVVMTSSQLRHWRNSLTLLQRAARVEPSNFVARVMLGNALFERRQLDAALRQYQAALRLRRDYPEAWLRAGVALTELGRPAEAMPYLTTACQLVPSWPEPQRRLGLALLRQGGIKEARDAYHKLIPLIPPTAEGYRDLADMLAEGQQYAEAIHYFHEALRLKPDFAPALNNLAMLRASCKQPEFRNGGEAVQLAEAACRLSGRRNPSFLGTLAAAYAEAGRFPEAVKTMQEALALTRASGADDLLPMQTQMLQEFRAGKALR
jgi:cytochrome c-type biogenesis protein CcmH/NrfG